METTLERFIQAQRTGYACALEEIRNGRKRSHWIWYIFPQLRALGRSGTAQYFGILDETEARAYLAHPVLSQRLREISEALLNIEGKSALQIFGDIDTVKLRSSMTLFAYISEEGSVFHRVLNKYFDGEWDKLTLNILRQS